jgi:N-acetylneuraminic acid mutarotase
MIVWGGTGNGVVLNSGGRYNPSSDSWKTMSSTDTPSPRSGHKAVWTGNEMIVWGGINSGYPTDTWVYTPGKMMYLYQLP